MKKENSMKDIKKLEKEIGHKVNVTLEIPKEEIEVISDDVFYDKD